MADQPPPIRVAVIGTGGWAGHHARVFAGRPDVELCGILGRDRERTQKRATAYRTRGFTHLIEMLEEARPELISICLPNFLHAEVTLAALAAQQGQYTLETVSPKGERHYERITAIREVIPYDRSLGQLIAVGASDATRIISFTVTEAGYYLDSQHHLDLAHTDLRCDIEHGTRHTIYGAIAAILRERMQRGGGPVTLLTCDNLRSNGTRFRAGLLQFLMLRAEMPLRTWVETHTSSPCNMVDRITPRPSPEVAQRVRQVTGWDDQAAVMGESFIQWVIEDDFIAGRPAWERVGAEMVASVHAHEEAKIRILNATHSCVAWAGTLKGLSDFFAAFFCCFLTDARIATST